MKSLSVLAGLILAFANVLVAQTAGDGAQPRSTPASHPTPAASQFQLDSVTEAAVHLRNGLKVDYRAVAGTLVVGSNATQDANIDIGTVTRIERGGALSPKGGEEEPFAGMFYTAYFAKGADADSRPLVFIYNGGPGSASMYLHMASVGPVRVLIEDTQHQAGGPYRIAPNPDSLLDVADLVFIDAPGTGYSRVSGKDGGKAFYGVDQDADAFDRFIRRFLTKYGRWASPRFLFGESYGTTRDAVLSARLQKSGVDLNGIVLLSQLLSFNNMADNVDSNWGTENGAFLILPSFAATAWYHSKIASHPTDLQAWLHEVEGFAVGQYAAALLRGSDLSLRERDLIAAKLESYTGVSQNIWLKANLRLTTGQFAQALQGASGLTTGRSDSRYQGPVMDPMASEANLDPSSSAIQPTILAAMNMYAHRTLQYGEGMTCRPSAGGPDFDWDTKHVDPFGNTLFTPFLNVSADLGFTMTQNPKMHVLLMGGYFDLVTGYFGAIYEMKHLPIERSLQENITYHFFQSGHMIYVNDQALREMHDCMADFIRAAVHS